ncbi:MAG: autotransporter-associated beta strand repeat-containing protein [Luteolibacter sp.]
MKRHILLLSLAVPFALTANAQTTFTWTKGNPTGANLVSNPDLWTTSSNWSGNSVPSFGEDNIVYYSIGSGSLFSGYNTSMNGDRTLGGIIFGQSGVSYGAGARIYIDNTGTLTLQTSSDMPVIEVNSTTADIFANITGNQGLYKTGSGRLNLNTTAKTYTGTTHVNSGSLLAAAALASQDFVVDEDGELFFSGSFIQTVNSISSVGTIKVSSGATVHVDSSLDNTISGVIANGSTAGHLRKSGTGRLTLESSNTYTGTTGVYGGVLEVASGASIARGATVYNGGTLQVDGEISQAGSYTTTIQSGGTLTGSGIIGGATTFQTGSIHSPGNSPGIQTFENNLTYQTGTVVVWELDDNTVDALDRGINFDGIDVTGNLTFSGTTTINLSFNLTNSLVDWTNALWGQSIEGANGWKIYDVGGTLTGGSNVVLSAANTWLDSNGLALGSVRQDANFYLTQVGSDLYLNYTAPTVVPEPTMALLSGISALGLLRRRR